jgi:hypothetical protein
MHKQAALNTFLTVAAFGLSGLGFYGMMFIAPMFTLTVLGIAGVAFLIKAIYNIEVARLNALKNLEQIN